MMNIHYSTTTGQIMSFGSAKHEDGEDSHFEGCKIMMIESRDDIGPGTHIVDLKSLELVPLPKVEQDSRPNLNSMILKELTATDAFMVPDRPMSEEMREAWRVYRQKLRDLSKLPESERLKAWPQRPVPGTK